MSIIRVCRSMSDRDTATPRLRALPAPYPRLTRLVTHTLTHAHTSCRAFLVWSPPQLRINARTRNSTAGLGPLCSCGPSVFLRARASAGSRLCVAAGSGLCVPAGPLCSCGLAPLRARASAGSRLCGPVPAGLFLRARASAGSRLRARASMFHCVPAGSRLCGLALVQAGSRLCGLAPLRARASMTL